LQFKCENTENSKIGEVVYLQTTKSTENMVLVLSSTPVVNCSPFTLLTKATLHCGVFSQTNTLQILVCAVLASVQADTTRTI